MENQTHEQRMKFIELNVPTGRIAIGISNIVSVVETKAKGLNNTTVNSQIYVNADPDAFNILETYEVVMEKIRTAWKFFKQNLT